MARETHLFDDTYTGPRWTYGLTYRPLSMASVPKGAIIHSDRAHPAYRHGTVDFPRQLTDEEIAGYELALINTTEEARAH